MKAILSKFRRNHLSKVLFYKIASPKLKASSIDIKPYYLFFKQEFPFLQYKTDLFEASINKQFNEWSASGELEYIIRYDGGVLIEPEYGFALDSKGDVIEKSLPYGEVSSHFFPHYIYYKKKKGRQLNQAVSIYYNWFNYWHFCNDVMGQLYLLEKEKFDKSIPIIVPEKALQLKYVDYFFRTAYAKKWNWIFQKKNEYISVAEVTFCKSIPNIKAQFIFAREIFREGINFNSDARRRLFLKRSDVRGRFIANLNSIKPLLEKSGIEVIDADSMTMEEQIVLFSEAELIIGSHGAGLTNMLYRHPENCCVIEIFPEGFTPTHYYWLANELNFGYQAILGGKLTKGGFEVALNEVEVAIKNALSHSVYNNKLL